MRLPELGDRVKVQTTTGGCYHKKMGTVNSILNKAMIPLNCIPSGIVDRSPYWWRVTFDVPANNGGVSVLEEIFLPSELTII